MKKINWDLVIKFYKSGMSQREVARKLAIDLKSVSRILNKTSTKHKNWPETMKGNKYALGKHWKLSIKVRQKLSAILKEFFNSPEGRDERKRISKRMMGKKNPNWHGGISFYPYSTDFNGKLKEKIRKRDCYVCQFCGKKQNGRAFPVHHIDYDKNNLNLLNLITLCNKHNVKVNFNRKYWRNYFQKLIGNKYGKVRFNNCKLQ